MSRVGPNLLSNIMVFTGSINQRPLNCGSFILLSPVSWVKNSEVFVCSNVMGVHPFKAHPKQKVSSKFGIIPTCTFTNPQHLLWGDTTKPLRNDTIILHLLQGTIKHCHQTQRAKNTPCRIVVLQNSFQEPRPKGSCLTSCGMPSGHAVSFAAGDGGKTHTEHRAIQAALFQIERAGQKLNRIWMVLIERHHQDFSIASLDDREE